MDESLLKHNAAPKIISWFYLYPVHNILVLCFWVWKLHDFEKYFNHIIQPNNLWYLALVNMSVDRLVIHFHLAFCLFCITPVQDPISHHLFSVTQGALKLESLRFKIPNHDLSLNPIQVVDQFRFILQTDEKASFYNACKLVFLLFNLEDFFCKRHCHELEVFLLCVDDCVSTWSNLPLQYLKQIKQQKIDYFFL